MPARRIPSLNWLRVFEAAARLESFARAAEDLAMSAPAVSQQIRALEGYLGTPLFERSARRVVLTEAGRAFLPTVANALLSVEAASAALFGRADAEPLTVQVTTLLACAWLPERLQGFTRAHPEIQLTLINGNLEADFRRPGADMAIRFGHPPTPQEAGDALFGERLIPVALPAIAERIERPEDLAAHTLIEVASHRATWYRLLPESVDGAAPDWRFSYTDTTVIALALARAGAGIALARAPASDALVEAYGLVPCLPGLMAEGSDHYALIRPASRRLSPAMAAFRDWLLAEAAAEASTD